MLAFLSVAAVSTADLSAINVYTNWLTEHNKPRPASETDFLLRASILHDNVLAVSALNSLQLQTGEFGAGVEFELNHLGDMSADEFRQQVLMRRGRAVSTEFDGVPASGRGAAPSEIDWRTKGAVTPVKDQGTVGSCWAFSTTGNIEGLMAIRNNKTVTLSEEFLVDCDSKDCGVFGGWPYNAYTYIKEVGGIPSEAQEPYCCGTGACFPCMANPNKTYCGPPPTYCNKTHNADRCPAAKWTAAAKVSSWKPIGQSETDIAAELASTGPLSVLLDATGLQFYKSGVWDPASHFSVLPKCKADVATLDHAVLAVGYGTDGGKDYWLVRSPCVRVHPHHPRAATTPRWVLCNWEGAGERVVCSVPLPVTDRHPIAVLPWCPSQIKNSWAEKWGDKGCVVRRSLVTSLVDWKQTEGPPPASANWLSSFAPRRAAYAHAVCDAAPRVPTNLDLVMPWTLACVVPALPFTGD
jgi:cathepsin F